LLPRLAPPLFYCSPSFFPIFLFSVASPNTSLYVLRAYVKLYIGPSSPRLLLLPLLIWPCVLFYSPLTRHRPNFLSFSLFFCVNHCLSGAVFFGGDPGSSPHVCPSFWKMDLALFSRGPFSPSPFFPHCPRCVVEKLLFLPTSPPTTIQIVFITPPLCPPLIYCRFLSLLFFLLALCCSIIGFVNIAVPRLPCVSRCPPQNHHCFYLPPSFLCLWTRTPFVFLDAPTATNNWFVVLYLTSFPFPMKPYSFRFPLLFFLEAHCP